MLSMPFDGTTREALALALIRAGVSLPDVRKQTRMSAAALLALYRERLVQRRARLRDALDGELCVVADADALEALQEHYYPLAVAGDLKATTVFIGLTRLKRQIEEPLRTGVPLALAAAPHDGDLVQSQRALASQRLQELIDQGHDTPEVRAVLRANDLELMRGAG